MITAFSLISGTPFGFSHEGVVRMVVFMRGVPWNGTEVSLPSGCGVVGGSAFDHEWRELRLKRESVVRMLGL
jgi:menaquinone-specific isochorismate synthase